MNPVHRDPEFAVKTRFKSPIAHGMTAMVMLNHSLPSQYQISSFTIRFMKPIYPGYELASELKIGEDNAFEMLLSRGEEKITIITGVLSLAEPQSQE
jgi:acyl dehydratase